MKEDQGEEESSQQGSEKGGNGFGSRRLRRRAEDELFSWSECGERKRERR